MADIANARANDIVCQADKDVVRVVLRCNDATENQRLDLSSCFLASFPDAVYMLMRNTQLISVDLSQNVLRKITSKLPQNFTQITTLNLAQNRICSLPDEFQYLEHLTSIDLSHNDFMSVPWVVYKMKNLKFLDLSHNYISDADVDMLKTLDCEIRLQNNPLSEICSRQLESENLKNVTFTPYQEDEV